MPLGITAAIPAAMNLAGNLFNIGEAKKGRHQARAAARRQFQRQQKLNKQGYNLAMKMWKNTNYEAQMEQMRKAGLNPSLLYGMSGGGGVTSNAGSGGSAGMQQATANPYMDIGNSLDALMMQSQIDVNEATAKKLQAEAEKTSGVDTEKTVADTLKSTIETAANKAQLEFDKITKFTDENAGQIRAILWHDYKRSLESAKRSVSETNVQLLDEALKEGTLEHQINNLILANEGLTIRNEWDKSGISPSETTYKQAYKVLKDQGKSDEQVAIILMSAGITEGALKTLIPNVTTLLKKGVNVNKKTTIDSRKYQHNYNRGE